MKTKKSKITEELRAINKFISIRYYKGIDAITHLAQQQQYESLRFRIEIDNSQNFAEEIIRHEFWSSVIHLKLLVVEDGRLEIHYAINQNKAQQLNAESFADLVKQMVSAEAAFAKIQGYSCYTKEVTYDPDTYQSLIDQVQNGELPHATLMMNE